MNQSLCYWCYKHDNDGFCRWWHDDKLQMILNTYWPRRTWFVWPKRYPGEKAGK